MNPKIAPVKDKPEPTMRTAKSRTTRAIIGIDPEVNYQRALRLFARLGLKGAKVTLLSIVEPLTNDIPFPIGPTIGAVYDLEAEEEVRQWRTQEAKKALEVARNFLESEGINAESELDYGFASSMFLSRADRIQADLLVTASAHHGALTSALFESVSRAAAISAKQSVLIAKSDLPEGRPLSAVLATDHSSYCNKAIEKLIELQPTGLRKITVLTGLRAGFSKDRSPLQDLSFYSDRAAEWRKQALRERSEQICDRLWKIRIQAQPMLLELPPQQSIEQAMKETQADLLIIAAQGHGFFERLRIGSLSLHEVVSEHHSLLILRP